MQRFIKRDFQNEVARDVCQTISLTMLPLLNAWQIFFGLRLAAGLLPKKQMIDLIIAHDFCLIGPVARQTCMTHFTVHLSIDAVCCTLQGG